MTINPAAIKVRVLGNGERATLTIPPGYPSNQLTPELMVVVAKEVGVQVTPDVLKRVAEIARTYAPSDKEINVDVAVATAPVHGRNAGWSWLPEFAPDHQATNADGGTDHYSSKVVTVKPGTAIARIAPAEAGVDGITVTGKVIPAKAGNGGALRPGKGLTVRSDGTVAALADGVLRVEGTDVSVSPVLRVDGSVDFATGHINFTGDVAVAGAVRDGFKVNATGDITVNGPVEGADIACGGVLRCTRGVASARRSKIACKGAAEIAFMRNADANFEGDLACRGELESCATSVSGALKSPTASVIGGTLVLAGKSEIGVIGSPDWTPTTIRVGELPIIAARLKSLAEERARLRKESAAKGEELARVQAYSAGNRANAAAREQVTLIQFELSEINRAYSAADVEYTALEIQVAERRAVELHVTRAVHPRTVIEHGGKAFEVTTAMHGPLRIGTDEKGELVVQFGTQPAAPIAPYVKTRKAA
ncbi:MAG: FapA family protein [Phycisphaerales bacterium]